MKLRILELFGGIGAFTRACEALNLDFELVNYIEFDKNVVNIFNILHKTNFQPTDIKDYIFDENIDIVVAGFPCQDLTQMGQQKGMVEGTRSSLIFTVIEKLKKCQNRPKIIILENVKAILSKFYSKELHAVIDAFIELGYSFDYQILNSKNFGVPQNRERVFFLFQRKDLPVKSFVFHKLINKNHQSKIRDIMDFDYKYSYCQINEDGYIPVLQTKAYIYVKPFSLTENKDKGEGNTRETLIPQSKIIKNGFVYYMNIINNKRLYTPSCYRISKYTLDIDGICPTLMTHTPLNAVLLGKEKKGINTKNEIIDSDGYTIVNEDIKIIEIGRSRMLYGGECFALMGFHLTDSEKSALSVFTKGHLYHVAGNSIVVDILKALLEILIA